MADTLQDFLVSVKFHVDAASHQNFLASLAKAATSTLGLSTGITGLAGSLIELTKRLAETGDQFYWMSQRLGMSVLDIKDATFALSNLGISSEHATQALEGFADWQRKSGVGALAFLRAFGVTATDTATQIHQIAEQLRLRGGTFEFAHGTPQQRQQYALARAWAESMHIDEQTMLALTSGELERFEKFSKDLYESIGLNKEALDAYAASAHEVRVEFNELGQEFKAMRDAFAAELFKQIGPQLQNLVTLIKNHMPEIVAMLRAAADVVGLFLQPFGAFIRLVFDAVDAFERLDPILQQIVPGLKVAEAAWIAFSLALMRSPLGRIIVLLEWFLKIMDDWKGYEEGKRSFFDWGKVDAFSQWLDQLTGVKGLLWDIVEVLGVIALTVGPIRFTRWAAQLLGFRTAAAAAAGAGGAGAGAAGAGAGAAGGLIGTLRAGLGIGAAVLITNWLKGELDQGSDWLEQTLFGKGATEDVKKVHEEGAKQFWDFVYELLGIKHGEATPSTGAPATGGGGGGGGPLPSLPSGGPARTYTSDQLPETRGDLGTRAFNPGNLNYADWEGAAGHVDYEDPHVGGLHHMAVFRTMQEGLVAHLTLLLRNQERFGKTLEGAYHGYAQRPYFKDIARSLGIDPSAPLDLRTVDPAILEKLEEAGYRHEGRSMSSGAVTPAMILQAIEQTRRGPPTVSPAATTPQGGAGGGQAPVVLNQSTAIHVAPGPNAGATATAVAAHQGRVNETMVRNAKGALR